MVGRVEKLKKIENGIGIEKYLVFSPIIWLGGSKCRKIKHELGINLQLYTSSKKKKKKSQALMKKREEENRRNGQKLAKKMKKKKSDLNMKVVKKS